MFGFEHLHLSWRSLLMLSACVVLLVLAIKLLSNTIEQRASRWLGLLLALCVIDMGPQIIGFAGFYAQWPGLTFFPFNTECWIGAVLYLHFRTLTFSEPLGWRKLLLIPGVIQTTYYLWAFTSLGDYKQKWAFNDAFHEPYVMPIESGLSLALLVFALVAIFRGIPVYQHYLAEYSSKAVACDPTWLNKLLKAGLLSCLVFVALEAAVLFSDISYPDAFPFQVIIIFVMIGLAMDAVNRLNQAFPKMDSRETSNDIPLDNKHEKDWSELGKTLDEQIRTQQWFLDPDCSLVDIARKIGSNEVYVSKAFNKGLNVTFNDYINDLRIGHAKHLLAQTSQPILDIALSSGFSAKSTFNRVFKVYAQQTPRQYRNVSNL